MEWDPTSGREGLDWLVTRRSGLVVAPGRPVLLHVPSTATQNVASWSTFVREVNGTPQLRAEVFDAATLASTTVTTDVFRPNETVSGSTATGAYTDIDESSLNLADYIEFIDQNTYAFRVDTGSVWPRGGTQRITGVRLFVVAQRTSSIDPASLAVIFYDGVTGHSIGTAALSAGADTYTFDIPQSPVTNTTWTEAEIVALDVSTWFEFDATADGTGRVRVYQAWIEVDWVTEPVLSTATATPTGAGWVTFTPGGAWSKANSTDYLLLIQETSGQGSAVVSALDGADQPGGWVTSIPVLDGSGYITDVGADLTRVAPLVLDVSGSASVDSQPYVDLEAAPVHVGVTVYQEITPGSSGNRGYVEFVARSENVDRVPAGDLTVAVTDSSGAVIGTSTLTVPSEVLADAPGEWHVLPRDVDWFGTLAAVANLSSGTQYRIRFTSTATEGAGWEVAVLSTASPPASADARGFGGTTDRADTGSGEADGVDLPVVVSTVPTAPSGFSVTDAGVASWTATSLAGNFARYIIEKLYGAIWWPVAYIGTEATTTWTDIAARPGTVESYRMRVQSTLAPSLPTATDTATIAEGGNHRLISPSGVAVNPTFLPNFTVDQSRAQIVNYPTVGGYPTIDQAATSGRRIGLTIELDQYGTPSMSTAYDILAAALAEEGTWLLVSSYGDVYAGVPSIGGLTSDTADAVIQYVPFTFTETADRPAPLVYL